MCVTYSPEDSKNFYINGDKYTSYNDDTITTTIPEVSSTSEMALSYSSTENTFHGNNELYIVKIYNRALSQAEITQNYNSMRTRFRL